MTLGHIKGNLFDKSIQISRLPYGVDSRSVDLVWSCLSEIDQYRIMQELFSAWETHENKEEMRSFLQLSVYLSHNNGLIYFLNVYIFHNHGLWTILGALADNFGISGIFGPFISIHFGTVQLKSTKPLFPNYLELGFEFGPQRIMDLMF